MICDSSPIYLFSSSSISLSHRLGFEEARRWFCRSPPVRRRVLRPTRGPCQEDGPSPRRSSLPAREASAADWRPAWCSPPARRPLVACRPVLCPARPPPVAREASAAADRHSSVACPTAVSWEVGWQEVGDRGLASLALCRNAAAARSASPLLQRIPSRITCFEFVRIRRRGRLALAAMTSQ